ncbi:MAG TPA: hypothetical protein VLF87_00710 [Patescibacteria group bacterium]|nr:hypothetical protein [Patescibacteria group bacterium]
MSKILTVPAEQQVISVKEARKLLGQKAKTLTNKELEILIQETETVVRLSIRTFISSKNIKNSGNIEGATSL